MPGILRDFLTMAIGVVVMVAPAIITDLVLATVLFPTSGLNAFLYSANTSAYIEAPTFSWGTPLTPNELLVQARIRVPYSFPLNVMLVYVSVQALLAVIGLMQGDRKPLGSLLRGALASLIVATVLLVAFNQGVTLLRPVSASYATNVQYAIPYNAATLGAPPAFFLTEFNLATIPKPPSSRVYHLPATTLFGIIGIVAVAYIISVIAYVIFLIAFTLLVLIQVMGRWLFIPAVLAVVAMPLLNRQGTLRKIASTMAGVTLCSVVVVPFLNYMTNGVLFALPGITAQLASGVVSRMINAAAYLGSSPSAFNPSAFCEALLISNCAPFQNPNAPLTDAVQTLLRNRFANLSAIATILLLIEICFIALVFMTFTQGVFWGTVVSSGVGGLLAGASLSQAMSQGWKDAQHIPGAGWVNSRIADALQTVRIRQTTQQETVQVVSHPQTSEERRKARRRQLAQALRVIGTAVTPVRPEIGLALTGAAEVVDGGLGRIRTAFGQGDGGNAPQPAGQQKGAGASAPPTPSPAPKGQSLPPTRRSP